MKPNKLEQRILDAAEIAQKKYMAVSNGFWLWHAPESFWQTVIVQEIARRGHAVYSDISINRIKKDIAWYKNKGRGEKSGRGRHLKRGNRRPDISVWSKSTTKICAIIELKRTYASGNICKDAEKVKSMLCTKSMEGANGYLLIYTDVQGTEDRGYRDRREKVRDRFTRWANKLSGWVKLDQVVKTQTTEKEYAWGFALFRFKKT